MKAVDSLRWSVTSSTTVSCLTLSWRTLAARRVLTLIAGAAMVKVAFDTDPSSEIVSVSWLTWVLTLIRRRPFLTTTPLDSDVDDLENPSPEGSEITTDFSNGALLPDRSAKLSAGRRPAKPFSDVRESVGAPTLSLGGGGGLTIVQLNCAAPVSLETSDAETVTDEAPATLGDPEMTPVKGLMLSPAGSPVAA